MTAYSTIVADPPWPHSDSGERTHSDEGYWSNGNHDGKRCLVPYERMTIDDIAALPVGDLAAKDAHLYLWTTNGFLRDGYVDDVTEAYNLSDEGSEELYARDRRRAPDADGVALVLPQQSDREVVIRFRLNEDDDAHLTFMETFDDAWTRWVADPNESYEVVSDTAALNPEETR